MGFLEDIRVVDLGLRLELKSRLGLEKVGDHCSRLVNHQIISSLHDLGVSGSPLSLLSSYLNDHTYWVTWRGSVFEPCPLTTWVPQGSVPGSPPLLSVHQLSQLCHSLIWLYLPQLRRWHPTSPLFSPIWNTGSSKNLCLSDWHLSVAVCTPPENQSWQVWTTFPSRERLSHPWPYYYLWQLCASPHPDC